MKTIYAVVCQKQNLRNHQTGEFLGIVGLFRELKKAKEAMDFWEQHKTYDVVYGINNITTDLLEDEDGKSF